MQQRIVTGLLGLLLLSLQAACADETANESCPTVEGVFVGAYQWLDGSCGAFIGNVLSVKENDFGTVTKVENRLSDTVMTEYIFKGCTVTITQDVEVMGKKASIVAGDLNVQEATEMTGKVMRTEYTEDGAVRCNSVYQATFRRQDLVLGGAVQHAAVQP
jgi:hypothetical protein